MSCFVIVSSSNCIEKIRFTLDRCFFIVRHHLSESDDIPASPMSPLAPPLPEGAVVASEKRMVIVKHPPRSLDSSHSRLNSLEIESEPRNKVRQNYCDNFSLCTHVRTRIILFVTSIRSFLPPRRRRQRTNSEEI